MARWVVPLEIHNGFMVPLKNSLKEFTGFLNGSVGWFHSFLGTYPTPKKDGQWSLAMSICMQPMTKQILAVMLDIASVLLRLIVTILLMNFAISFASFPVAPFDTFQASGPKL